MKKFTKVMLVIAAVLVGIGLVCLITSVALGARWRDVSYVFSNLNFGGSNSGFSRIIHYDDEDVDDDDFTVHNNSDSDTLYYSTCSNLDIELGAGELTISTDSDLNQIEVRSDGAFGLSSKMEGDTLKVKMGIGISSGAGSVEICVPESMEVEELDIEVGAGEAEISLGSVRELEAEVGMGSLSIDLQGEESDYSYDIECGIGEVTIGDVSYSGIGGERKIQNPSARRKMKIECGIGEVTVEFE